VELEARQAGAAIAATLTGAGFDVRGAESDPVGNSSVAGESGITVSEIAADRSHPRGCWLWVVFDNVRAHADNLLLSAALLSREVAP
jgi:aspartate-semialdehyde dehydrogenase